MLFYGESSRCRPPEPRVYRAGFRARRALAAFARALVLLAACELRTCDPLSSRQVPASSARRRAAARERGPEGGQRLVVRVCKACPTARAGLPGPAAIGRGATRRRRGYAARSPPSASRACRNSLVRSCALLRAWCLARRAADTAPRSHQQRGARPMTGSARRPSASRADDGCKQRNGPVRSETRRSNVCRFLLHLADQRRFQRFPTAFPC
jgi:hypothetical protein